MSALKPYLVVAEDDESVRRLLVRTLEEFGYEAVGVANGAAALAKIRGGNRRPDLIVLDLNMPVLNGWEFLAVREGDPVLLMIPVIVLTGETRTPPEMGHSAFLTKPVDSESLKATVARILEEANPDPERAPRPSEPWSIDGSQRTYVRNSFARVVAVLASEREARRVVAAVNGVSRVSTSALENGIIDKGLECLFQLHRYDTDDGFRKELDAGAGLASVLARRDEIARLLDSATPSKPSG